MGHLNPRGESHGPCDPITWSNTRPLVTAPPVICSGNCTRHIIKTIPGSSSITGYPAETDIQVVACTVIVNLNATAVRGSGIAIDSRLGNGGRFSTQIVP